MKYLALILLFIATTVSAQKTNPFVPKGKAGEAIILAARKMPPARGVITFAQRPSGYYVLVNEVRYSCVGDGPKTAGIYDVVVDPGVDITITDFHSGGKSKIYTLRILVTGESPSPSQYSRVTADPRRLIVYSVLGDLYHAMAVDYLETPAVTTYYTAKLTSDSKPLPLGMYDFLLAMDKKDELILNVYTTHIVPNTTGTTVHVLRVTDVDND